MNDLLEEFPTPAYSDWKSLVEADLAGIPFKKKLSTKTSEGIALDPLYTASSPGSPSCLEERSRRTFPSGWAIAEEPSAKDAASWNTITKASLARGLTAIRLKIKELPGTPLLSPGGVQIETGNDLAQALDGLLSEQFSLHLEGGESALGLAALFLSAFPELKSQQGTIGSDQLSLLLLQGHLSSPVSALFDELAKAVTHLDKSAPKMRSVAVDARPFHIAGATIIQELACSFSVAVEYLRQLDGRNFPLRDAISKVYFQYSIGPHFFLELAKFRAARLLWREILAFLGEEQLSSEMVIHGYASTRNLSKLAPEVNILRETTEAVACVIGGVNLLVLYPFETRLESSVNPLSLRISRNIQLILQDEVRLQQVADPAGGSWYIEQITRELAEQAFDLFKDIEAQGGFVSALRAGKIQDRISEAVTERRKELARRERVLVGTSMYVNLNESLLVGAEKEPVALSSHIQTLRTPTVSEQTMDSAIAAARKGATISEIAEAFRTTKACEFFRPLPPYREAEEFEALRARAEQFFKTHEKPLQAFFAAMGDTAEHRARSDFSASFLIPGGFECLNKACFQSIGDAAEAAVNSEAEIVVICGSNTAYPELVPALTKAIKAKRPQMAVVLAGYLEEHAESFLASGVDEFIHLRADHLRTLSRLQQLAGVA